MRRCIVVLALLAFLGSGVSCAAAPDTTWPLAIQSTPGQIEIYQPQPDSLQDNRLKARAAVSLLPAGANEPLFGAIWIEARLETDRDNRTATLTDIQVKDVRLPEAGSALA